MREIKFRVWDKNRKRMYFWENIEAIHNNGILVIVADNNDWMLVPPNYELLQYTGLKDKDGKEIYEGDILSFAGNITADDSLGAEPNGFIYDETSKHVVVWDEKEGAWFPDTTNALDNECWKYRRDTRLLMRDGKCEIIGNIYENPELIPK